VHATLMVAGQKTWHRGCMSFLPPHAIEEFQILWMKHYGVELSREEASARAHQVVTLVRLIAQSPTAYEETVPTPLPDSNKDPKYSTAGSSLPISGPPS
jgi:hypothetical protein